MQSFIRKFRFAASLTFNTLILKSEHQLQVDLYFLPPEFYAPIYYGFVYFTYVVDI